MVRRPFAVRFGRAAMVISEASSPAEAFVPSPTSLDNSSTLMCGAMPQKQLTSPKMPNTRLVVLLPKLSKNFVYNVATTSSMHESPCSCTCSVFPNARATVASVIRLTNGKPLALTRLPWRVAPSSANYLCLIPYVVRWRLLPRHRLTRGMPQALVGLPCRAVPC